MNISLTIILIAITVIASFAAWNRRDLRDKWIHNPYSANKYKEYWRLLTSGFIHADYMHIFFNMWAFYLFGDLVEQYFTLFFGGKAIVMFLLIYLGGIVVANIPDFIQHKNNAAFNSLGASGGVSSIVFCAVILQPTMELIIFPIPIPMPAYIFAILYVAYSVYMEKRQMDNVNHMAHLWGAIWGVVFIAATQPQTLGNFMNQILGSF